MFVASCRLSGLGLSIATAMFGISGAFAQSADPMVEILVTARKKEESLLTVPVAITAFTAEAIEKAGIRDLYDIAELTPGLSFFNAQGEFLPVPVVRGVAPTDIFGETNVGIFVDGIYVSGREGLNFSQLDLQRIEVVKGPQSALYGRNAFGGAINYITRQPTEVFEATGEVTYGNDGRQGGKASVGGPIIGDTLLGRLTGLYDEFDGSYDNPLGGQDIGGYRYRSWQGSLQWRPAESLTVNGAVYYSNDGIDDAATTGLAANCENRVDSNLSVTRLLNVCGELPTLDEQAALLREIGTAVALQNAGYLANGGIPKIARALGEDRELTRAHLVVDWDVGFGTLSFLTGYSETSQTALIDGNRSLGDQIPFVICTNAVGGVCSFATPRTILTTGLLQIEQEDKTEETSQEIRFTSPQDERFRYSVGGYYYDVTSKGRDGGVEATAPAPAANQQFGPFVGPGIVIGDSAFRPWFKSGGDLDPLSRVFDERDTNAWSLFASSEYDLTDRLTIDGQLRYGEEDKYVAGYFWEENLALSPPFPLLARSGKDTFDAWTGRLGLKFKLSEGWIMYGSISNGEKSGGFDVNNVTYVANNVDPAYPCDDPSTVAKEICDDITVLSFDSETIVTTEIGIKGRSSDGRLMLDLSIYRNNWDDITIPEVFERDPVSDRAYTQPESFNTNPGDATIIGWDLELGYQLTDNLNIRATGSMTDATFDSGRQGTFETFPSFRPGDCQSQTVTTTVPGLEAERDCKARSGSIAGNTVLRQPKWQASLGTDYVRAIAGDWEFFAGGDASYQGKVYIGNDNQSYLPDRTYVNLRLGLESARYTIELWGRNIFDNDEPIAAYRDVFFTNTDDYYQEAPASSPSEKFFPIRYTVSHPRLRTFGVTGKVRFGGAAN